MSEHHRMFVDGEWIEAVDGGTFVVFDPATGEVIGSVPDGGPAETARAVEAAHRAFPAWAAMPARERAPILHRIQSLMEAYTRDLGRATRVAEALECGLVGLNAAGYTHEVPFGGFKESGLGREGGREGLEEYLETKSVVVGLPPAR